LALVTLSGFPAATSQNNASRPAPGGNGSSASPSDRFVGTWKLIDVEQRNAAGQPISPSPNAGSNRLGYLVYDPARYVTVTIMPVGRKKNVGPQATDAEALAAITGYSAYFGTFTVNQAEGTVTHHLQGSLNPGMSADQKRFFEVSGNRLTLKPPAA